MAINSYFFNANKNPDGTYDRTYNAESFSNWLSLIVGNGVFPNPSTNLQVEARTGFNIIVNSGSGWINGHKMDNTIYYPLTVDGSDVLLDRIDRVIFYLDYTNRVMGIEILKGTPAEFPVAPDLTNDDERVELCLAEIAINHQVTEITQADITDTRADSTVCGWVAGLIEQVDTSTLFTQWQTAYTQAFANLQAWQAAEQAAFEEWLNDLTQELRVDTYIQEYQKTVSVTQSSSKIIPMDMTGYTYEESDIIFVIINGLVGIDTTDYLIDTRQSPPEIHINLVGSTNVTDDIDIRVLKSKIGISPTN